MKLKDTDVESQIEDSTELPTVYAEDPIPCICCGKILKNDTDNGAGLVDGADAELQGGYYSNHDTIRFRIAVCDECISSNKDRIHMYPGYEDHR